MKKHIWAIAATILMASTVNIVSCTKDNTLYEAQNGQSQQQKSIKSEDEIVIAEWSGKGVTFRFDKEQVLSSIQSQLKDSLEMTCIMEDIRIYIKDVDRMKVPVVEISYFDIDQESSVTMFGILRKLGGDSSPVMLALGCDEICARCVGVNCKKGCNDILLQSSGGVVTVIGCTACTEPYDPKKSYWCDFKITQRLISNLIFRSFQTCMI